MALALFEFESAGTLLLTEAGTQRRASIHLVRGHEALAALDAGGIDVMTADLATFAARLATENHTVKRALTMPQLFSGTATLSHKSCIARACRRCADSRTLSCDGGAFSLPRAPCSRSGRSD